MSSNQAMGVRPVERSKRSQARPRSQLVLFSLGHIALKNVEVPVEMHLYAEGGHAFGLRRTKFPITKWPQLMETWLGTIGMISK